MKIKTDSLLSDLIERTKQNIDQVERLNQRTEKELNEKGSQETWSVLECIEHLNLYAEFYIQEIEQKINQSKTSPEAYFKSGIIGNKFANSMLPSYNLKKIKTFKDKNPNGSNLSKNSIKRFLEQQNQILELLKKSRKVNLSKTKTSISISKLLKLKLGDSLKVLIYHNERHIAQANKVLEIIKERKEFRNLK